MKLNWRIVVDYIQGLNLDPMECFGSIEYDPFRIMLQEGRDNPDWENEIVDIVKMTTPLPRYRAILVSGNRFPMPALISIRSSVSAFLKGTRC